MRFCPRMRILPDGARRKLVGIRPRREKHFFRVLRPGGIPGFLNSVQQVYTIF
jgi:hypothetical protein